MTSRTYTLKHGKQLVLGKRTLVMGILNVTPDSFSDGGRWNTVDRALKHMEEMVRDGADIIDIGAESSRPGFVTMPAAQEIDRLMPFLDALVRECPVPVSVDTFKAETAREAAAAGADMLNDIWGMQYAEEPGRMAEVAASSGLPIVVMHNQDGKEYPGDIIASMKDFSAVRWPSANGPAYRAKTLSSIRGSALARRRRGILRCCAASRSFWRSTESGIRCCSAPAARALSARRSACR